MGTGEAAQETQAVAPVSSALSLDSLEFPGKPARPGRNPKPQERSARKGPRLGPNLGAAATLRRAQDPGRGTRRAAAQARRDVTRA